jgi:hypothetical protein
MAVLSERSSGLAGGCGTPSMAAPWGAGLSKRTTEDYSAECAETH